MPRTGWTPDIVPSGADQTAYLVIDRFRGDTVYRETEIERADLETIITDRANSATRYASSPSTRLTIGRRTFPSI